MLDKIARSSAFLAPLLAGEEHAVGLILGTGLGGARDAINARHVVPYAGIPHFPVSTVQGHAGQWIVGEIDGRRVIAMQGRFHFYEGYSMQEVTFPVRVMRALGVKTLVVSNAAGGVNPDFQTGDLMVITDHINLFPEHPLRGKNEDALGPRFPEMAEAYSPRLIALAGEAGRRLDIPLRRGVYAGLQGPSFETPAEYRWIRVIGGDAVGMSTVPEVIVARHAGMECFGLSVITNSASSAKTNHEEVQEAGRLAQPRAIALVRELIRTMYGQTTK
ncbi:MAG: purine-nucleoside phosphorylase [Odoribacteraceae bacterium]|jgi:purine-nucleoside phosphorylase|nr:purine-nucleoside phosphorylase [Odoribacteraceae bacterium]